MKTLRLLNSNAKAILVTMVFTCCLQIAAFGQTEVTTKLEDIKQNLFIRNAKIKIINVHTNTVELKIENLPKGSSISYYGKPLSFDYTEQNSLSNGYGKATIPAKNPDSIKVEILEGGNTLANVAIYYRKPRNNLSEIPVSYSKLKSTNYYIDMCNFDYNNKTQRPLMYGSNHEKLRIKDGELLTFQILNNNPLRYTLAVNKEEISFHVNDSAMKAMMGKISKEQPAEKAEPKAYESDCIQKAFDELKSISANIDAKLESYKLVECIPDDVKQTREDFLIKYVGLSKGAATTKEQFNRYLAEVKKEDSKNVILIASLKDDAPKLCDKIDSTLAILFSLGNSYSTLPISVRGKNIDILRIKVDRTDVNTKQIEPYEYDFFVRGGIKLDFSAGMFGSGLVDHQYGTTDSLLNTIDSAGNSVQVLVDKTIYKKEPSNYNLAVGAVMHIYPRVWDYFNFSADFGFATDLDQKFIILTGLSAIVGRAQRACFFGGVAWGKVKRLDNAYTVGDVYTGSTEPPTYDKFTYSLSVGFCYDLTPNTKTED